MKKIILMAVVALMATMSAEAQRIRTIDKDGQPVPYVSVLTTDARYIGVTDINGVIEDVKGADTISVSHVVYKPKLYKVNGKSGTITLEDADQNILQFERAHKIPALAPAIQKKLNELWKMEE